MKQAQESAMRTSNDWNHTETQAGLFVNKYMNFCILKILLAKTETSKISKEMYNAKYIYFVHSKSFIIRIFKGCVFWPNKFL